MASPRRPRASTGASSYTPSPNGSSGTPRRRRDEARQAMSGAAQTSQPVDASVDSTRAVFFALGGNLAIAVAKFVAAAITGSGAMLAEGLHSAADCANQLLLLLGLKRAQRPP